MTPSKLIRIIFSFFVIGMIALFATRLYAGLWIPLNWGMMLIPAIVCMLVFSCFVYIFNFSYALACIGNGVLIFSMLPSVASGFLCGAIVIYGLRLLYFTWVRRSSDSYASHVAQNQDADQEFPVGVKIALWVQCTLLYTFQSFAIFMVASKVDLTASALVGAGVVLLGTLLEGTADSQKQAFKNREPDNFITTGLYTRCRHPNYSGEILVQAGLLIAGIGAVTSGWVNYATVIIAPVYIVLLMISEALAKDSMQLKTYGERESYRTYLSRSRSLLPGF
ncbi:MAG: DUF1295 domain-containing protein [Gammaproteobacteria bacterium]|jgi:steroid 5-alpha reductase family enzyme|nr:DUF1295 domain-containing protein [Gammaproteobacteria bacterium]MDP6617777.1 DUF1295 domain-containing protein [Gammaproteobacteria bacterium]MDP6694163.1 DUF1295 domain-containing protein [Gammaproteobacteria bacterium]